MLPLRGYASQIYSSILQIYTVPVTEQFKVEKNRKYAQSDFGVVWQNSGIYVSPRSVVQLARKIYLQKGITKYRIRQVK